ncbi:hypothetical protein [Treponema endosymbiont of Eucomonympha sp.]|uniref:hypothetical protein n=1 Tax=Treponema endosymbiont of Eucomonympha sp. TaxID=1580831 RepID=UPI001396B14F|nr:hypothetical protein [Treponema endosymbiont of Eucomonympha sp.]
MPRLRNRRACRPDCERGAERRAHRGKKKEFRIAFGIWQAGFASLDWDAQYDEANEKICGKWLKRREFRKYLTDEFWLALSLWADTKRYGFPSGRGWASEPAALIDLIKLFDSERDALEAEDKK